MNISGSNAVTHELALFRHPATYQQYDDNGVRLIAPPDSPPDADGYEVLMNGLDKVDMESLDRWHYNDPNITDAYIRSSTTIVGGCRIRNVASAGIVSQFYGQHNSSVHRLEYASQEELDTYAEIRINQRLADEGIEGQRGRIPELQQTRDPILDYRILSILIKENRLQISLEATAGIMIDRRLSEVQSLRHEVVFSGAPRDVYSDYYDGQILPDRAWIDMQSFLISALSNTPKVSLHRSIGITHGPQLIIAQELLANNLDMPKHVAQLTYGQLKEKTGQSFKRGEALQVFAHANGKLDSRRVEPTAELRYTSLARYAI